MTSAHEEREAAQHPVGPRAHAQHTRHHGEDDRREGDDGRVDAGEARDEVLGFGLLLARVLHELQDAAHGGLAEGLGRLDAQAPGHVDAAGDDIGAHLDVAGDALAREGGGVKLRGALDHAAVDGHALAGLDHDDVAHLDLVRINLNQLAVALDIGVVGRDVHHLSDRFAALAHGVALEELSDLVEQHDGAALGRLRFGFGEQDRGEGADGGHGHEERLVEGVAASDVVPCLYEHVVAGDEKRYEVQDEGDVGLGGTENSRDETGILEDQGHEEQGDGDENTISPRTLFLVHGRLQLLI